MNVDDDADADEAEPRSRRNLRGQDGLAEQRGRRPRTPRRSRTASPSPRSADRRRRCPPRRPPAAALAGEPGGEDDPYRVDHWRRGNQEQAAERRGRRRVDVAHRKRDAHERERERAPCPPAVERAVRPAGRSPPRSPGRRRRSAPPARPGRSRGPAKYVPALPVYSTPRAIATPMSRRRIRRSAARERALASSHAQASTRRRGTARPSGPASRRPPRTPTSRTAGPNRRQRRTRS